MATYNYTHLQEVSCTNAEGTTDEFVFDGAGGAFFCPSNATITWYAAGPGQDSFYPLEDSASAAVTQTATANTWLTIDPSCNNVARLKAVLSIAGPTTCYVQCKAGS